MEFKESLDWEMQLEIVGYSPKVIAYHPDLLHQASLIEAKPLRGPYRELFFGERLPFPSLGEKTWKRIIRLSRYQLD
jgi:hypothetical protein